MSSVLNVGRKINAQIKNYEWKKNQRVDFDANTKFTFNHSSFQAFSDRAYKNKSGYAIRINPITGEKEMFIAGTRNKWDWAANLVEVKYQGRLFYRKRAVAKYQRIADREGVSVIYGHSRGGALVADMRTKDKGVRKYGLDAAMLLANNRDKGMKNYRNAGTFDKAIGLTGTNVTQIKTGRFHKVWGNKH